MGDEFHQDYQPTGSMGSPPAGNLILWLNTAREKLNTALMLFHGCTPDLNAVYTHQKEDLELPVTAAVIWEEQHKDTEIGTDISRIGKRR